MHRSLAFLLGLLAGPEPVTVAAEDFAGEHGNLLRLCQRLGFLSTEPCWNPRPSCLHCEEGVPLDLDGRLFCGTCQSTIDAGQLLLWQVDVDRFASWLAQGLDLKGENRRIDGALWQLGTLHAESGLIECFFCRSGVPDEAARQRLLAYRSALVLRPLPAAGDIPAFHGDHLCLLELLTVEGDSLMIADATAVLHGAAVVSFDEATGVLRAGTQVLGEVPPGSKEHALLTLLWRRLDEYVPYSDLKQFVLRQTGSRDATEEATFCQRLKNRVKKAVPEINRIIATTNKGQGYRLRPSPVKP